MMEATDDLHRNKTRRRVKFIEMKRAAIDQGVASFCNDLKSLGELWKMNHEWMENISSDKFGSMESINLEKLVDKVMEILHDLIKVAVENCERMYQDGHKKDNSQQSTASCDVLGESQANQNSCFNPIPTTSISELKKTRRPPTDVSFIPRLFRSLRSNAKKKPEPIQKRLLEASKSGARPAAALAQNSYFNAKAPPPPPHRPMNTLEPAASNISGAALTKKSPLPPPLPAAKEVTPSPPKHEPLVPENIAVQGTVDSEPAAHTNAVVTIKAPPPAPPPLPPRKLPPVEVATVELPPLPTAPKIPQTAKVAVSPPPPPAPPPLPAPSKGSIPSPSPPPAPPPLPAPSKGSIPSPSPPPPIMKGAPLPPPPLRGATKSLYPKKATTRLRRSTQIASLYRFLKGKIEGTNLEIQLNSRRNRQIGGSAGGKQGMADTIVEMKKRSAYYQKIEKDMQTHGKTIMDLKAKINSFQTKDMIELIKFRNFIESHLENLTDETQVLAKFEDFPTKKLEALRAAAALRLKLEAIVVDLQNWKIAPPLGKLLDQTENYFNKMKQEIDTLERRKDEESKMFKGNNVEFDFSILVRIKELIVDISSRCMELALQESREAKQIDNKVAVTKSQTQRTDYTKMLWRAFQFAFRVYSFAGGHDDHADRLSKELAHEIETSS